MLESFYRLRVAEGNTGSAYGYLRAINAIKETPFRIQGKVDASKIKGVGPGIADKIQEFRTTGYVAELANIPGFVDREAIIKEFITIDGVGPVTAEKWFNQGYRKISDIPWSELTHTQQVSIRYHSELIQRIPRSEIDAFKSILDYINTQLGDQKITFQIAGSYRRGKPDSGDVDVIVMDQPGRQILNEFIGYVNQVAQRHVFTDTLSFGEKKFLGVGQLIPGGLHRRIDLELVAPHEYIYALVYFTGPASFNVKMREYCRQHGLRLNEKSLTDSAGNMYSAQTEEELFQKLGLAYLTPEERDKY